MSNYSNFLEIFKGMLLKNGIDANILGRSLEILKNVYEGFSDEEIFFSLNPSIASITSPYIFPDMSKAVKKLIDTLKKGENILIFGDRDADGIIATFIVKDFLEKFKKLFKSSSEILFRVPEEDEDYGILPNHIDEFLGEVSLIITVDNGISAVDAVRKAKENGIDVIITDHHEYHDSEISKWAFAIIDPKKDKVGKEYLSGSGVAFYFVLAVLLYHYYGNLEIWYFKENNGNINLVKVKDFVGNEYSFDEVKSRGYKINALFADVSEKSRLEKSIKDIGDIIDKLVFFGDIYSHFSNKKKNLHEIIGEFAIPSFMPRIIEKLLLSIHLKYDDKLYKFVNAYSPLVGLTVLSDNMPIVAENKFFVISTVSKITKSDFESVRYLCSEFLNGNKISVFDLIMKVIPFINTPGRMGKTSIMLEFLLGSGIEEIVSSFSTISKLSKERINIVNELVSKLMDRVDDVVIVEESVNKGIISLLSTRLSNYTNKPVIVIGEGGEDKLVGSARFKRGDVFSLLKEIDHYFLNFGGHKHAAGFVMERNKLGEFVSVVKGINFNNYSDRYKPLINISIKDFATNYVKLINLLEPLNTEMRPLFETFEIIEDYKSYGKMKYAIIDKFRVLCDLPEDKMKHNLNKRVKIIYSYEYSFAPDLQEEIVYPKILEIENE